jgi:molybdopterin converting factor small subunit
MAAATSDADITLELHGFLADRLAALGRRRGTRTLIALGLEPGASVSRVLTSLVEDDRRYEVLFDPRTQTLPEHIDVVLNDRVLDLQGGLNAVLQQGDVLTFLPAHAGGGPGATLGHLSAASVGTR